jgi:hypothetical protein
MRKILFVIGALCFYSCTSETKKTTPQKDSLNIDTATAAKAPDSSHSSTPTAKTSKWSYTEQEDKMTSKKKYFASIDANELLQFDFPYDGGVTANLTIRHQDGENEAILQISKGQFITGVDGTTIKVRVDDAPAVTYSASGPSDGSTEILFINSANKLINKMKTAKKVMIQAEFYDSGNKVMEFEVDGFKWTH